MTEFTRWKTIHHFKFGENMNVVSLVKKLQLELQIPKDCMDLIHTRNGNMRVFDTQKLAEFFGMTNFIENGEDTDIEM
jgi:hypothetical protein